MTHEQKITFLTDYLIRMYESRDSWARQACLDSPIAILGSNDLRVLSVMDCGDRLNMGALSGRTGLPLSTLTGITDKLVVKGFLDRTRSLQDRRVVEVGITRFGAQAIAHRKDAHQAKSDHILSALNPNEQDLLLKLLAKVVDR